jgi:hypothetical protein
MSRPRHLTYCAPVAGDHAGEGMVRIDEIVRQMLHDPDVQ